MSVLLLFDSVSSGNSRAPDQCPGLTVEFPRLGGAQTSSSFPVQTCAVLTGSNKRLDRLSLDGTANEYHFERLHFSIAPAIILAMRNQRL
jgi:hypothetical protein